ncbi:unnamed protein product [Onchocerca flexuosa]|uniref:Ovule protein n=1 Tax=Onchocerca flexuosa TaxID=387005 RepID=A0A183GZP0_9BILA|nr:unnamed protein product [Onchocerca flexuosa]
MEQSSSPHKSPQCRNIAPSLSISSSITARSPIIYVSATKPRRPKNPFMNDTYSVMTSANSISSKKG